MNVNEYIEIEIERSQIEKSEQKTVKDGHGNVRTNCLNNCGAFGDGWGSLKGYCTNCKHDADVNCKCILHGCGEKYWTRVNPDRTHNLDGELIA